MGPLNHSHQNSFGAYEPTAGQLELEGAVARLSPPVEAQRKGVETVCQTFDALPLRLDRRRKARDRALEFELARCRLVSARKNFDESGFTGPIITDQPNHVRCIEIEGNVLKRMDPAKRL